MEMFGHNTQHHIWWKPYTRNHTQNYKGGDDLACFASTRPGHPPFIESTRNFLYQSLQESIVVPSLQLLNF